MPPRRNPKRPTPAELAAMAPGSCRNSKLNAVAFSLGGLGAYGLLNRGEVYEALRAACTRNGVLSDDGEGQFKATFESGWGDGLEAPRELPTVGSAAQPEEKVDPEDRSPLGFRSLDQVRTTRTPVRWLIREVLLANAFCVVGGAEKTQVVDHGRADDRRDERATAVRPRSVQGARATTGARALGRRHRGPVPRPDRAPVQAVRHRPGRGAAVRGHHRPDQPVHVGAVSRGSRPPNRRHPAGGRDLDPAYTYVAAGDQPGNVFTMGRLLADLRDLCTGRVVVIGHHFTKAGADELSLASLTQAGFREVADHWLLVAHAQEPDLDTQSFRLRARCGARRGFAWDATLAVTLGRLDLDTIQHVGTPSWQVLAPEKSVDTDGVDWKQEVYQEIRDEPWALTQKDLTTGSLDAPKDSPGKRRSALAWLRKRGVVRTEKLQGANGERRADRFGPALEVDLEDALGRLEQASLTGGV